MRTRCRWLRPLVPDWVAHCRCVSDLADVEVMLTAEPPASSTDPTAPAFSTADAVNGVNP